MSASEINESRCTDCNRPSIEARCDRCQCYHEMEEAGGPRMSESQFEGIHHGDARSVEVIWGPDEHDACGWFWLPVTESRFKGAYLRDGRAEWCGPFATSRAAMANADIDGAGDEYPTAADAAALDLVRLDEIGTLCLRILDAADLNPFSFGPSERFADDLDSIGRDARTIGVLANEDDESFSRDCFNGCGLMGGCYMPAVTYHSAERIAPYAPHLIAADFQRAAEWCIEPAIVHNRERMNLDHWPSLCVFLACMAIEEIARQIDEARESREEASR